MDIISTVISIFIICILILNARDKYFEIPSTRDRSIMMKIHDPPETVDYKTDC